MPSVRSAVSLGGRALRGAALDYAPSALLLLASGFSE
jgi:hypothetical protein